MPRKNINADEIIYNKWSPEYIKNLMAQIRDIKGDKESLQSHPNFKKKKK